MVLNESSDDITGYNSQYQELESLGSTSYLVRRLADKELCVAKKVPLKGKKVDELKKAVSVYTTLKSENIVQLKDYFISANYFITISEYCKHGDLSVQIENKIKVSEKFDDDTLLNWLA